MFLVSLSTSCPAVRKTMTMMMIMVVMRKMMSGVPMKSVGMLVMKSSSQKRLHRSEFSQQKDFLSFCNSAPTGRHVQLVLL